MSESMNLFGSKNARPVPSREEIAERIKVRGQEHKVRYLCPVCRHTRWDVAGVLSHQLEPEPRTSTGARTFVPTAILICGNCAYCAQFSLVALGLLD